MKSTVALVAAAFLATVQGFDFPGVPACATSCLAPAITKAGCGINDQACQCGPTQSLIANYAVSCLLSSCDSADLMQAESAAVAGCSEYSATAGKTSATSTATTAPTTLKSQTSAQTTAQTTAQTSIALSVSGVSSAVTSAPTITSGSSSSILVSSAAASTESAAPSSVAVSNGTIATQTPAVVLSSDGTMLVMSGSFVALIMAVVAVL